VLLPAPVSAADYLGCTFTRKAADYRALTLAPVSGQDVASRPLVSCGPCRLFVGGAVLVFCRILPPYAGGALPPTTGPLLWLLSLVRVSPVGRLYRVGLSLYSAALPTVGPASFRRL
jgi:hypothetical protein